MITIQKLPCYACSTPTYVISFGRVAWDDEPTCDVCKEDITGLAWLGFTSTPEEHALRRRIQRAALGF